jgi:serine/threonine protein kinase
VHDLGVLPDGRPFLAMKLIKGETFEVLLKRRADPVEGRGRFVAAFEQVCQAVAYAHAHDVINRDLKPANVMVGAFGEVQVMGWTVFPRSLTANLCCAGECRRAHFTSGESPAKAGTPTIRSANRSATGAGQPVAASRGETPVPIVLALATLGPEQKT